MKKVNNFWNSASRDFSKRVYDFEVPEKYSHLDFYSAIELYQKTQKKVEKEILFRILLKHEIERINSIINSELSSFWWTNILNGYDDIFSEALIGFRQALDRFDISKWVKFNTFSWLRIKWAIIDYLRKTIWIVIVSKKFLGKIKKIEWDVINILDWTQTSSLANLNIKWVIFSKYRDVSLSWIDDTNEWSLWENELNFHVSIYDRIFSRQIIDKIEKWIISLTPREKEAFYLLFTWDCLDQREIANLLWVHEVRINQYRNQIIKKIQDYLWVKKNVA